ncbi:Glycoprotein hormone alpha-2, partial [Ophiophagus hannah]
MYILQWDTSIAQSHQSCSPLRLPRRLSEVFKECPASPPPFLLAAKKTQRRTDAILFFLSSPAFNVTLRSDHQGMCRGTRPIQACVGYCESSAFPSKYSVLLASSFKHNITSVSQCCTISRTQTVRKFRRACSELCPLRKRNEIIQVVLNLQ